MNWDQVEGNWKELRGKVQAQWGDLHLRHSLFIALLLERFIQCAR